MAKRRSAVGNMKRTRSKKTKKRLEAKRVRLEELAVKRSKNTNKKK